MKIRWGKEHGVLLKALLDRLNTDGIRYFILRNYELLPEENSSKDVDIIFEPGKMNAVRSIMMEIFRQNSIQYFKEELFGHVHSFWGVNIQSEFSIHIDLIEGYYAQGYSVFSFDEMYSHVIAYKSFYVLDELFSGIMLFVYKQFGYKKPKLKDEYKREIVAVYQKFKLEFHSILAKITSDDFATASCKYIENNDFASVLANSGTLNKYLRRYVWKKKPISTIWHVTEFTMQRLDRMIFRYRKYSCNFAVLAPDGTGKTTFLDTLIDKLNYYRVCRMEDNHISVYHFRPNILPNLGAVGEKAGLKKQDTNFSDPHRNKPAGTVSSLVRISYYTLDYILGWRIRVRKDTKQNKWSIFDRYSYDLIVDPLRTRLSLPISVRNFFVALTPKPEIVFCLMTDAKTVYARKQELKPDEIERQLFVYRNIAQQDKRRFSILDASKTPDEIADDALRVLFDRYMEKL